MTYESPFAKAAMTEAGLCISGGKYNPTNDSKGVAEIVYYAVL